MEGEERDAERTMEIGPQQIVHKLLLLVLVLGTRRLIFKDEVCWVWRQDESSSAKARVQSRPLWMPRQERRAERTVVPPPSNLEASSHCACC